MTNFPDPFGRTRFESRRPNGDVQLEIAPGQYVCDFCTTPDPRWEYPCGLVVIAGSPDIDRSDDEWAACDECHELIQRGDVGGLVERMVEEQAKRPLAPGFLRRPVAVQRRLNRQNVIAFFAARTGQARPLS